MVQHSHEFGIGAIEYMRYLKRAEIRLSTVSCFRHLAHIPKMKWRMRLVGEPKSGAIRWNYFFRQPYCVFKSN